jgi:hypothetical protein
MPSIDDRVANLERWAMTQGYKPTPDVVVTPNPTPPPPPVVTGDALFKKSFEFADILPNRPHRGLHKHLGLKASLNEGDLNTPAEVVKWFIQFPTSGDANGAFLEGLRKSFQLILSKGKTAYIKCGYSNNPPINMPMDVVLKHVKQAAPVFNEYSHAISAFDFGWLGAWSELHGDANTNDDNVRQRNVQAIKAIYDAEYSSVFQFMVRYPKITWKHPQNPLGWFSEAITEGIAYKKGRGQYGTVNDYSMEGLHEGSSWFPWDHKADSPLIKAQKEFVYQSNQWAYYGCETVPVGGDKGPKWDAAPNTPKSRAEAVEYARITGLSLFNGYGFSNFMPWLEKDQALAHRFKSLVGYNLLLNDITVNPGEVVVNWGNKGSTGLHRPKKLVLRIGSLSMTLSDDVRLHLPRGLKDKVSTFTIPKPDLARGTYPVSLGLIDAHKDLANRREFSIQLNNRGVDFDGFNTLGELTV